MARSVDTNDTRDLTGGIEPWEGDDRSRIGKLGCPDRGYFRRDHERVLIEAMNQALNVIEHSVCEIRMAVLQQPVQQHQHVAEPEDATLAGGTDSLPLFTVRVNYYLMAKRRRQLIGTAPELLLADGGRIVFGRNAKMFGRPDGSLEIVGPWRRVQRPRRLAPGEVVWDNPPGSAQGVTIGTRTGAVYISANDAVTPTQASRLLQKSTVWIYRLIKTEKLRPTKERGRGRTLIPLSEIKRVLGVARPRGAWLTG